MSRAVFLLLPFISGILASSFENIPFLKQNKSYVRIVDNEEYELPTTDFVFAVSKLLDKLKNGDAVTPDELNKFGEGITQYYSSRAYEYYFQELRPPAAIPYFIDPILLPNVTSESSPVITFCDVKVYGFPPFKHNYKVIYDLIASSYFENFEISFKAPSQAVIFTGNYIAYDGTYFFIYVTEVNDYETKRLKVRNKFGVVQPKKTTATFSFVEEQFAHTYDTFMDHYSEINTMIFPKFTTALENVYLPKLAATAESIILPKFSNVSARFTELYRQKLIEVFVQATVQMASLQNLTHLQVRALYFKNEKAYTLYNRTAVITYDNITIEGLTNFVKYEFSEPRRTVINKTQVSLTDKLIFTYPENGSQIACLSFNVKTRLKETTKRFRIKNVIVDSAFAADVSKLPPELTPNRTAFDVAAGFSISFDVDLEDDEIYYFVVKHAGFDLVRTIDSFLYGTVYPEF